MRILLTGCAGFIGAHLTHRLVDEGYSVIGVDNLITGNPRNLRDLKGSRLFRFVRADVCDFIKIQGPLDAVLHFASPASPADYLKHPVETLKAGSLGTHNALDLARAKGAVFLLASTSEIYGDPLVTPQKESYWGNVNSVGPRSVYDEAKRFAEALSMAYARVYGLPVKIARIFNTYGPMMRPSDGRAIPNFITQALRGKPITIYGRGQQTRSFMYVSDLVSGLYKLLKSSHTGPMNIGNPRPMSILALARVIKRATHSSSPILFKPLPQDDPRERCPDIRLALRTLRWKPRVHLDDGLVKTVAYFAALDLK